MIKKILSSIFELFIIFKAKLYRKYLRLTGKGYVLTLFAAPEDEGRTELPTERKKRKAREEEGRVVNSAEINQTLVLAVSIAVIALLTTYFTHTVAQFFITVLNKISNADASINNTAYTDMLLEIFVLLAKTAGIIMAVALVVGVGVNLAQTQFLFTTKKLKPNFKRIAPTWSNFKERVFISSQNLMNLAKILFKMIVISLLTFTTIYGKRTELFNMINMGLSQAMNLFFFIVLEMLAKVIIFMIIVSAFDYFFQKRQYINSLKMTKHEMKEEFKEMEGDPLVKSQLQEMARKIVSRTMLKSVPEADVVITNPTHFAVALKYENGDYAPIVTAKGADHIALKIKEIARQNDVQIVENKPLARELYYNVELGQYIPEKLFHVVSRILGEVYRIRNEKMARAI
ncbi:flagellar biosynthesis protein FlhB [Brachyspira hyodysenteriae]|uniref:Flagellar biosynthetic protein FlhB n=2 Tax=Brachyspira hyodysenteriae TaxID=159 RepID=A0A3B6V8C0_BRAHW|nr:flagellar biosynthesis protein FlhB [Brachyspira hyodysenteriae]ACN82846.1 flagellar biosynthesis protein FlhB [Brachyspira hyodysenteriae WA1]ANN62533.1 flagellar biosynthesis protein FlhB [Brachyspira hyodysenteriae ATCC 27164]AUJ48594.1 flagellar biosynthesis protein FlhB [Brachyspira hyodysenteriae]KLI15443.1 flagellar biosynthesis protein FlhB [Brachyspira hyodysenteriae]KLI17579.1 flagellar biosynthesis protein FlhB [Brachyspira hyodysenteriae]